MNKEVEGKPQFIPESIPGQEIVTQVDPKPEQDSILPKIELHDVEGLPSRGLAYHKGASIQFRPYMFGELKQISQSNLGTKGNLEFVLNGITTSFDKYDLTLSDLMFIGFLRRISTLGTSDISVQYQCQGCGQQSTFRTDSSKVGFDELDIPKLPVIAPLFGEDYEFRPITVKQYFELVDIKEHNNDLALIAKQCNKDWESSLKLFFNADSENGSMIDEIDRILYHGLSPIINKCENTVDKKGIKVPCGYDTGVELDGGQALIMPFRKQAKSNRDRIRFGS